MMPCNPHSTCLLGERSPSSNSEPSCGSRPIEAIACAPAEASIPLAPGGATVVSPSTVHPRSIASTIPAMPPLRRPTKLSALPSERPKCRGRQTMRQVATVPRVPAPGRHMRLRRECAPSDPSANTSWISAASTPNRSGDLGSPRAKSYALHAHVMRITKGYPFRSLRQEVICSLRLYLVGTFSVVMRAIGSIGYALLVLLGRSVAAIGMRYWGYYNEIGNPLFLVRN